ncbi:MULTISPECIES: hypothetical protein [unclassified Parvimonas]|uniref:hypothetical protein n=1 Tax=unclassified Parvimonas TaxID=1151464 RepID=UPI002B468858|nr:MULTISPECIES: hypothetical protein [unclassified Parvimonas]MEB3024369.1 hypothetical protein [Parvimonas sp. M13]MEB3088515.1 hypothetical protein [Parvimonas sp. M20]
MKKEKGFLSFIEDLKSEIDDVKSQINEMGSDFKGGNTFKTSSKPKNKNSSKNNKKQSYRINNFEDYESPEGASVMTSSIEGNTIEKDSYEGKTAMTTSIEGKSIMNTSMEGQGQMYNSRKTERVALRNDIQHFDELIERKTKKFVIKGKESLSKAILYSEIIGKPKSLK